MKNMHSERDRAVHAPRSAAVAGMFYPGDTGELSQTIEELTNGIPPWHGETVRGIIAPHAGYQYSGSTAGRAYVTVRGASYESVIVVAPSHREYFEGVSAYDGSGYATPLGIVPIDADLREALIAAYPFVHASVAGHRAEHAVEVHLPFLQKQLGSFKFLPLVMGQQTPEVCFGLGDALATVLKGRNVLLVASTDLSHFYPDKVARRLDAVMIEDVRHFDGKSLMTHLHDGTTEACGGGPAVAVMTALRSLGATRMEIVGYATSGDVTGDRSSVVGYLGAIAL